MTKAEQMRLTGWRLKVLRQAADEGNVARVCHRFGIPRKHPPADTVLPPSPGGSCTTTANVHPPACQAL